MAPAGSHLQEQPRHCCHCRCYQNWDQTPMPSSWDAQPREELLGTGSRSDSGMETRSEGSITLQGDLDDELSVDDSELHQLRELISASNKDLRRRRQMDGNRCSKEFPERESYRQTPCWTRGAEDGWNRNYLTGWNEFSKPSAPSYLTCFGFTVRSMIPHMLLVDYGLPAPPVCTAPWIFSEEVIRSLERLAGYLTSTACLWEQGQIPDSATWDCLALALRRSHGFWDSGMDQEVWDAATTIYYYSYTAMPWGRAGPSTIYYT
ncbi:hypothetical protein N658DRAFT_559284, partial [Parathielavia hyrcaniae]